MGAKMFDVGLLIAAGFDPKTGLPIKATNGDPTDLKCNIKRNLRILDEQQAVNRYVWYNLPDGIDGHLLERMLYYKGQLAFFFMKSNQKFYILPYALDGTIDCYGRFRGITPIAFGNGTTENEEKPRKWIEGLIKTPVYDLADITDENFLSTIEDGCVLLHDYSKQLSEIIIPRVVLNDSIVDYESELLPLARTAAIASSGVKGLRVNDENESANVKAQSRAVTHSALVGDMYVPIVGKVDFQELTEGNGGLRSQEYLLLLQAVDNFRLSLYGLNSGGLMEKKAHELQSEADQNVANSELAYSDGLMIRQKFCDMVNAIWGLGIWCDSSETAQGIDRNGDGEALDKQDQSGVDGEQPQGGMQDAE